MKKLFIFILLTLAVNLFGQNRERFFNVDLANNAGSTTWSINKTADDTSAVFDLFSGQSISYNMYDPSASDSVEYTITVYASHQIRSTPDSTFSLEQTISVSSSGYDMTAFSLPTARKAYIIVTGGSDNGAEVAGLFTLCGWSNAEKMAGRMK